MKSITTSGPGHMFPTYVGKLVVEPLQQAEKSLGVFSNNDPAKGFSVEFHPASDAEDSVTTQITRVDRVKTYKLVLHVANYGDKTITAEVWKM